MQKIFKPDDLVRVKRTPEIYKVIQDHGGLVEALCLTPVWLYKTVLIEHKTSPSTKNKHSSNKSKQS